MNYPKATIAEIRKHIENRGGKLIKQKFQINGQDSYRAEYKDGAFSIYTRIGLNRAFQQGEI